MRKFSGLADARYQTNLMRHLLQICQSHFESIQDTKIGTARTPLYFNAVFVVFDAIH